MLEGEVPNGAVEGRYTCDIQHGRSSYRDSTKDTVDLGQVHDSNPSTKASLPAVNE